ncbi:glucan endo-1,3-beta-glucosidase 12-like [Apium graveolens]|uniref:glucan endo-1,3-beta-glucosidase 12-like n=1 Tax=Apium graveolens TaxID=4045 RepID=UPI003D7B539F
MNPLAFLFLFMFSLAADGQGSVGVNYGRIANNLPSAFKVAKLLKSEGITRVKVYDTDPAVLKSLSRSGIIKVTVDLPNELLFAAARYSTFANSWVQRNVVVYYPSTQIEAIAVGNEVFVDPKNTTKYLLPAMKNIHAALVKYNLDKLIKISSPIALSALQNSYPSSSGSFKPKLEPVIRPMLEFFRQIGSPLMLNAYPFFAYESNADVISLDYALFRQNNGVIDAGNGLRYFSLFDAQIDAVFAAMSALKYDDVSIVVTETGWPSKGDKNEIGASVENAAAYNGNLVKRVLAGGGTPLRPNTNLTVYLFALFNENKKFGPTSERNYGLFYPDQKKVYDISFKVNERGGERGSDRLPIADISVSAAGESWCVANVEAGKDKVQRGLDYACGEGGADCHPIQPGSTCFDPNTLEAHASFAFNSFYQKKGRVAGSCDFNGAAHIVAHPPKFGICEFPTGY